MSLFRLCVYRWNTELNHIETRHLIQHFQSSALNAWIAHQNIFSAPLDVCFAPVEVDASVSEVSGVTVVVIFVSAPVEVDAPKYLELL